ncbi:MAG: Lrp/AsnC family transcriptional regulator [Pseudomonadota bacterium]|nr:Lrp/AsnC family transcriptional regulator [Pseudomonadota bacterium]
MDRIDRKILGIYQHDTRRIAESIGAEVGLSAAAVQRRLKRLRAEGVVSAEIAVLDKAMIGASIITCIVTLSMAAAVPSAAPSAHLDRFRRQMIDHPMVQQCYHVTGTSDFVVIVIAESMEAYGAFARRWFESNAYVARYDTHVALERVKVGLSLPVDADGKGPAGGRTNL